MPARTLYNDYLVNRLLSFEQVEGLPSGLPGGGSGGSITAPVIVGNPVSGSTLSVDTGGTSLAGYNFNWQWNTDGGTVTTRVGPVNGEPYAPLALDAAWIGRYVRCRYRTGASGTWTVSGFVGPVTAVAPSPEP